MGSAVRGANCPWVCARMYMSSPLILLMATRMCRCGGMLENAQDRKQCGVYRVARTSNVSEKLLPKRVGMKVRGHGSGVWWQGPVCNE